MGVDATVHYYGKITAACKARGVVPDVFTLVPLSAVAVAALAAHRPEVVLAALVPAIPFIVIASLTRGRGLGWGDAKLAALGGDVPPRALQGGELLPRGLMGGKASDAAAFGQCPCWKSGVSQIFSRRYFLTWAM